MGIEIETEGPKGIFAVFSEDEGAGYFFIYKPESRNVLAQICLYHTSKLLHVAEDDIRLMWTSDQTKCGIAIWGRMRGILEIEGGRHICQPITGQNSPAVTDHDWLKGFDNYLDEDEFVRARQRYWKELVRDTHAGEPLSSEETSIRTNYLVHSRGPDGVFAVFEDDGDSGYLYVYGSREGTVLRYLHIYDRSERLLSVRKEDVKVRWAENSKKCGVIIWGKMRGILDLANDQEGRVWVESRDSPGIGDKKWLAGF